LCDASRHEEIEVRYNAGILTRRNLEKTEKTTAMTNTTITRKSLPLLLCAAAMGLTLLLAPRAAQATPSVPIPPPIRATQLQMDGTSNTLIGMLRQAGKNIIAILIGL